MRRRSFVMAGVLTAGLALGIVVAPAVGGTVSAQTQPQGTTQVSANSLRSQFLDNLAAALGVQRTALDSAFVSAGAKTLDSAVQQGSLTQAQADALTARVQAGDVGVLLGGRGPGRPGGPGDKGMHGAPGVPEAMFDAAAAKLGMTADELRTQLRSGQTLAQLAQAHNTTEQAVIDAALAAAKTKLAEAVTAGTITQAQADAQYAQLQQRGANLLNGPGRGPGGRPGRDGASPANPAAPTPATGQGA